MSNKRIQIGKASAKKKDAKRDDFHDGKKGIVGLGAGDSFYIPNFLHNTRKENEAIMARLMQEVEFVQMFYFKEGGSDVQPVPRMVSAQTTKKSGTSAIYRMPGCNEKNIETKEWSPTVRYICEKASEELKQDFNHCVCNLYRDQEDSLGLHYDKLLDLEDQSLILSISFGAARPFVFVGSKTKSKKETKTIIMLQPGSLIAIGPKTNRLYQHGIPKVAEEVGPRISLSLRTISTFVKEAPAAPATVAPECPLTTTAPAKPQDKEFEIMGRGEEFQTRNYPFVKNYAEAEEEWSDTIKAKIQKFKEDSERRFKALRAQFSPDESPMEEEEDGDDNEVEAKLVY